MKRNSAAVFVVFRWLDLLLVVSTTALQLPRNGHSHGGCLYQPQWPSHRIPLPRDMTSLIGVIPKARRNPIVAQNQMRRDDSSVDVLVGTPHSWTTKKPINAKLHRETEEPLRSGLSAPPPSPQGPNSTNNNNNNNAYPRHLRPPRLTRAPEDVEHQLNIALEAMKQAVVAARNKSSSRAACTEETNHDTAHRSDMVVVDLLLFPTTRECNAALAAFGDAHDLLRALQFFGKMRKASALQLVLPPLHRPSGGSSSGNIASSWPVPTPTLVTYSTLMSRFLKANKPAVALRLWDLMIRQSIPQPIDVKATNILMNCYAKLANVESARQLLQDMKNQAEAKPVTMLSIVASSPWHGLTTASRHSANGCSSTAAGLLPLPNSITYNTFLSACHKAGDLDAAVAALSDMKAQKLTPDIQTYTTLIATVARRPSQSAGRYDPSLAFTFLNDMAEQGIKPNGMTYSALIDVCGRCRRSDLALQSLRFMLQQKAQEEKELQSSINFTKTPSTTISTADFGKNVTLPGEVGAWTAAITACGKAGRLETAVRLFYAMEAKFGVQPNTITCGSLTDSLLKAGRTAETLNVLRYMKRVGIRPSEVMYTSLMSRAEKLVEMEQQTGTFRPDDQPLHPVDIARSALDSSDDSPDGGAAATKAIEVYTELIDSLINFESSSSNAGTRNKQDKASRDYRGADSKSTALLRAFLVFQQMKAAGVEVDVLCYNTLLRACAQAGDLSRAQDVIRRMQRDELDPNDTSWRLLLRSVLSSSPAVSTNHCDKNNMIHMAELVWKQGLSFGQSRRRVDDPVMRQWSPSVDSLVTLLSVYMREAEIALANRREQQQFYRRVLALFDALLMCRSEMGMNRVDMNRCLESPRAMMIVMQALVNLEESLRSSDTMADTADERRSLRAMATSILQLDCFINDLGTTVISSQAKFGYSARHALRTARGWASLERAQP